MMEFGTFVFEHFWFPGSLIILGLVADYVSTKSLKAKVASALKNTGTARKRGENQTALFLTAFVTGFLERLLGPNSWSRRFFYRSALLSMLFIGIALLCQYLAYGSALDQFRFLGDYRTAALLIVTMLGVTLLIDFVSNVISISLIRMAAASGKLANIVLIIFSDIFLTLALFTLIFPLAIVVSVFVVDTFRGPAIIRVYESPKGMHAYASDLYADLFKGTNLQPFVYTGELHDVPEEVRRASELLSLAIFSRKRLSEAEGVEVYLDFLRFQKYDLKQRDTSIFSVSIPRIPISINSFYVLYSSSYREANVTRDGFMAAARVEPLNISLHRVVEEAQKLLRRDSQDFWYRCSKTQEGVVLLQDLIKLETKALPCQVDVGVIRFSKSGVIRDLHPIFMGATQIPLTPFFFSSFAISILYYLMLGMLALGIFSIFVARKLFNSPHLESVEKPFFILALFASAPALVINLLLKAIF